jgi:hypothetical protein
LKIEVVPDLQTSPDVTEFKAKGLETSQTPTFIILTQAG